MRVKDLDAFSRQLTTPNFRLSAVSQLHPEKALPFSACLYRSSELDKLTKEEWLLLQHALAIECHIDLKSDEEHRQPSYFNRVEQPGWCYWHFPLSDPESRIRALKKPSYVDYANYYYGLLDNNRALLARLIERIAHSPYERFIISCYAGKDRTGVVIFLLLNLLNVNSESIYSDYELTADYLLPRYHYFQKNWQKRQISSEQYCHRLRVNRCTLQLLEQKLNKEEGGINAYWQTLGIDSATRFALGKKFSCYQAEVIR